MSHGEVVCLLMNEHGMSFDEALVEASRLLKAKLVRVWAAPETKQ